MPSFRQRRAVSWSEANGDLARRGLVGRSTGAGRIWPWVQKAGSGSPCPNVSQIVTIDKDLLTEQVGKLARSKLELLLSGIDVILGR